MLNNPSSDQSQTNGNLMSVLFNNAPTQAGAMVTIVNLVSQPFSQPAVIDALSLTGTDWSTSLPTQITLLFSFLLAIYQTRIMQGTRLIESLIVIPIVTGILFGMSLGANDITDEVLHPQTASNEISPEVQALDQEILAAKRELEQLEANKSDLVVSQNPPRTRGIQDSLAASLAPTTRAIQIQPALTVEQKRLQTERLKQKIEALRKKKQELEEKRIKAAKPRLYKTW